MTTYAVIRKSQVIIRGMGCKPYYIDTKQSDNMRAFPTRGERAYREEAEAIRQANAWGHTVVSSWAEAASLATQDSELLRAASMEARRSGVLGSSREGDGHRATSGGAACLLPKFSRAS